MSQPNDLRITFERGLMEYLEPSRVQAGFATELKNWEPESDGSLRARIAWNESSETGAPTTRTAKGLTYLPNVDKFLFANRDGADYDLLSLPGSDVDAGTWSAVETVTVTDATKFLSMAVGLGNAFYSTDEFSTIRRWDGTTAASITGSKPGTALAVHKNRVFSGGGPATTPDTAAATQPYRVWFSDLGDYTTWTDGNFFDVASDDGEVVECIVPFDNGLLIGKRNSLHYLQGSGPSSFQLVQLEGGGSAPGRSIVATPYGAVIAGRAEVYLWRGSYPEPIGRPISTSYGLTGDFLTTSYIDSKVYISDQGSGVTFVYNLETQAWSIQEVDTPASNGPAVLLTHSEYLYGAPANSTTKMMWYRQFPDGTRGNDEGLAESYHAKTPDLWIGGAAAPVTIRNIWVRIRQRGGNASQEGVLISFYIDGNLKHEKTIQPQGEAGVFRKRLDFGGTGYFVTFDFLQNSASGEGAVMDIEELQVLYDLENPR